MLQNTNKNNINIIRFLSTICEYIKYDKENHDRSKLDVSNTHQIHIIYSY